MAAIPGHIKDEVVILGCHRDGRWFIWHSIYLLRAPYFLAWVMGAADPTSGTVSLLEVVRGLGALVKRGWKPIRTLVIASWDAEEVGSFSSSSRVVLSHSVVVRSHRKHRVGRGLCTMDSGTRRLLH